MWDLVPYLQEIRARCGHSPDGRSLHPKHAVRERFLAVAVDKRPEATLLKNFWVSMHRNPKRVSEVYVGRVSVGRWINLWRKAE